MDLDTHRNLDLFRIRTEGLEKRGFPDDGMAGFRIRLPCFSGVVLLAFFLVLMSGCSTRHYRQSADREVYGILNQSQKSVLGNTNQNVDISTRYSSRNPQEVKSEEIVRERQQSGRLKPSLDEALKLAIENSRNYQTRKETLYLSALNLTRDRHDYRPRFFATAKGGRDWNNGTRSGSAGFKAGATQALKSGGSLGVSIANDLFRFYTGDPRRSAISTLSANFAQPLLRGAGASIAAENLTQSERNVIYEVRNFSYFQSSFAIDIVSFYFRLLQQKDTVRNEYNNYQTLIRNRERSEALARDRLPANQVDQARQDELNAKNRYVLAVQNYQTQVDLFKATLGLPLGTDIQLDDSALEDLTRTGLLPMSVTETNALSEALKHRLDLLNEMDRFEDAQRKVNVARDALRMELNLVGDASVRTHPPVDYANFDWKNYQAGLGLELNLPIDRLRERNNYRATLIAFERAVRSLGQMLDDVRDDVRQGLRTLNRTRQSYLIQKRAVDLALRRVEGANLQLQAGQVQMRDLLEAQNALLLARNSLTQSLVDYHLARLRFINDVGTLDISKPRFWINMEPVAMGAEAGKPDQPEESAESVEVIPPDVLFGK